MLSEASMARGKLNLIDMTSLGSAKLSSKKPIKKILAVNITAILMRRRHARLSGNGCICASLLFCLYYATYG